MYDNDIIMPVTIVTTVATDIMISSRSLLL
jgi:hypothetical protein